MEKSPLPVMGCKIKAYTPRSGPLSREGSLSCHINYSMGPGFFQSHPKDCPIQLPLVIHMRMWRIFSNPDHIGVGLVDINKTVIKLQKQIGFQLQVWFMKRGPLATSLTWVTLANIEIFFPELNIHYILHILHFHLSLSALGGNFLTNLHLFYVRMHSCKIQLFWLHSSQE